MKGVNCFFVLFVCFILFYDCLHFRFLTLSCRCSGGYIEVCDWFILNAVLTVIGLCNSLFTDCPITNCSITNCPTTR